MFTQTFLCYPNINSNPNTIHNVGAVRFNVCVDWLEAGVKVMFIHEVNKIH